MVHVASRFSRFLCNAFALFTLLVALLLPKLSAVIMELHPNIHTAVICAGDRLVVLRFDADMNPIEVEVEDQAECIAADGVMLQADVTPQWRHLDPTYETSFTILTNAHLAHERLREQAHKRGPPTLI
jgi:hypothetical protein